MTFIYELDPCPLEISPPTKNELSTSTLSESCRIPDKIWWYSVLWPLMSVDVVFVLQWSTTARQTRRQHHHRPPSPSACVQRTTGTNRPSAATLLSLPFLISCSRRPTRWSRGRWPDHVTLSAPASKSDCRALNSINLSSRCRRPDTGQTNVARWRFGASVLTAAVVACRRVEMAS